MAKPISADKRQLLLEGNLIKAILSLAIPVMVNSFIQSMYNITDTFWLGKIGTQSQAAITLVSPVQNLLIAFGSGITTAGSILISQYLGAKKDKEANTMANHIFLVAMIFSIACSLMCCLGTPAIVKSLGAEGLSYEYGKRYLSIVSMDLPFLFMINIYTAIKQSQGDTIRPMLLNLFGVVINMILDPLFLMYFNWGIGGAAFATLIAKVPCAVIAFLVLIKKDQIVRITFKGFKFSRDMFMSIIKIGLPTAVGGGAMQLGFIIMTASVNSYGTCAISAYGIGNKINSLITMPAQGIGSAVSIIAGQNFGANNIKRADKVCHVALQLGAIFLLVFGVILSRPFIAEPLVRIFTSDEAVVPMATDYLSLMAFWCWTNAFHDVIQGLFQGAGHTFTTVLINAARIWIFRFATLWVCSNLLHMGVESVWYAVVVSNAIASAIFYILYWTGIWKKNAVKLETN